MYTVYVVPYEMTLSQIAGQLGVDINVLKELNGRENDDILSKGSYLIVPKSYLDNFVNYKVKPGDTIISIAKQYDVDYKQLLNLNGLDKDQYIYVDQEIMVPNKGVKFWITNDDETLKDVANKLQISEQEILLQNDLIYLKPEQLLIYKKRD